MSGADGVATESADAVVVGAGPAGAMTALGLARRGLDVLLIDRRGFPRAKPCGDCLSPEAARVLDRHDLLERVRALGPARLSGWRIWSPDGGRFDGGFAGAARGDARVATAMALSRERLDDELLRAAVDAGTRTLAPLRVDALLRAAVAGAVAGVIARDRDGRRHVLRARLVVGADGLRSVVARRAGATAPPGPLRKLSFTLHPALPAGFTSGVGEMHVVPSGCIGIAPVESGARPRHNLTVVASGEARAHGARRAPITLIRSMLAEAPGLRDRLSILLAALAECDAPLASGPFDRPVRFAIQDGLALVGDAAGYYDPFTGQGVYQALAGGERLAQVAGDALARDAGSVRAADLREYAAWLVATRRPARMVQRAVETVTSRPALMNRFTRAIGRTPAFADALIATTGDIAPVRSLAGRPAAALALALLSRSTAQ